MESRKNNPMMALIQEENALAVRVTSDSKKTEEKPLDPAPVPEPPVQEDVKPVKPKRPSGERNWQRFSFVCSKEIIRKVHDISAKEGFTIRDIMELFLQRGIDEYEKKNGVAKPKRKKGVDSILK